MAIMASKRTQAGQGDANASGTMPDIDQESEAFKTNSGAFAENSKKPPGRPFLPGQSGNKGGRPRDVDGLRAMIREHGPALAEQLIQIAKGLASREVVVGDGLVAHVGPTFAEQTKATEVLFSYWLGRPQQSIEISTTNPIAPQVFAHAQAWLADPQLSEHVLALADAGAVVEGDA